MDWSFLIRNKESLCVTTDSRKITPGCVFVALKGEHFDGNQFVAQALELGAAYAITDAEQPLTCSQVKDYNERIIRVENSLLALQDLARAWRRTLYIPVIAITGTNGKTTTKELTAAVLSMKYNVHYTQGNYNNSLGVPLTLLQITRAHEIAIIEMGASHPGDIKELVEIAEPTHAIITNVGKAHLQGFGSFKGVMNTKAELYDYMVQHGGIIYYNADDPILCKLLQKHLPKGRKIVRRKFNLLYWLNDVILPKSEHTVGLFRYRSSQCPIKVEETQLVGDYNAANIAAATAIGMYFAETYPMCREAISSYKPTNNRSQLMQTEKNTVVVDAYNANPTSMQAAINSFKGNCYILGAMRELGEYSHLEHQNIVNMLLERKADKVLLVGEEYRDTTAPYEIFDNVEALYAYLEANPLRDYHILLKGSRSNQLEKIIPLL